jgi:hypothetical protein
LVGALLSIEPWVYPCANTDALSRRPITYSLMEISTDWKSHLLVEYSKDKFAYEILDEQVQDDMYRFIDDVIFYKD